MRILCVWVEYANGVYDCDSSKECECIYAHAYTCVTTQVYVCIRKMLREWICRMCACVNMWNACVCEYARRVCLYEWIGEMCIWVWVCKVYVWICEIWVHAHKSDACISVTVRVSESVKYAWVNSEKYVWVNKRNASNECDSEICLCVCEWIGELWTKRILNTCEYECECACGPADGWGYLSTPRPFKRKALVI
jgi:hypothetical protein